MNPKSNPSVPFAKGTPRNDKTIYENGALIWRPDVAAIRSAIMETTAVYSRPVDIEVRFARVHDADFMENFRGAAERSGRKVDVDADGWTIYLRAN